MQQSHQEYLQPQEQLQTDDYESKRAKDCLEKELAAEKNAVSELEKSVKMLTEKQLQFEQESERLRQNFGKIQTGSARF